MRKSKFTEEQIIAILAEQERGMSTAEVCRRHGVSSAAVSPSLLPPRSPDLKPWTMKGSDRRNVGGAEDLKSLVSWHSKGWRLKL